MAKYKCERCDHEFKSKDALNMHNQAKHPESYKKPRLSKKQKKKLTIFGVLIIIILLGSMFYYFKSISLKDAPIIEITPSSYNFGTVSQAKGTVNAEVTITNKGASDLIINNIDTSCGCTSASIIYNGVEGPKFSMSMHGTNPKNWKQVIPPGKTAKLKVDYNPNVHRNLRGAVTRSVFIFSNDPRHRNKEMKISAYQVD